MKDFGNRVVDSFFSSTLHRPRFAKHSNPPDFRLTIQYSTDAPPEKAGHFQNPLAGKCGVHKTVDSYSSLHGCGCSCFFLIYDNMEPNKSTNCIFMRCCLSGLKCQYSKYTSIFGGYKR